MKNKLDCCWQAVFSETEDTTLYETECGEIMDFLYGDITDNSFIYCPFCGKEIKLRSA